MVEGKFKMTKGLEGLTNAARWHLLVRAAKKGAETQGYTLSRVPGRGLSNIWHVTKDGRTQKACIRTTQDRWFAFPPLDNGKKWKTLSEVDLVIVAAVDSRDEPENVEVYLLPASEVRTRFDAAYAARADAGQILKNNFGMWVRLDQDTRELPASVGSGIIDTHKTVAVFPISELLAADGGEVEEEILNEDARSDDASTNDFENEPPLTIAEAKRRLAMTFNVDPANIKIIVEG
jgi:hypothetical protein